MRKTHSLSSRIFIAIVFGLAGFAVNLVDIQLIQGPGLKVSILPGLLFPLIIALAWGWRYGLLSALAGGCQTMWWLGRSDGWGMVYAVPVFTLWIVWHGWWAQRRHDAPPWYTSCFVVEIPIRVAIELGFYTVFVWLVSLNPPPWGTEGTVEGVPLSWLHAVAVKRAISAYVLLLGAYVAISLGPVRRFLGMPPRPAQRDTTAILAGAGLIGLLFWLLDTVTDYCFFASPGESFWGVAVLDAAPHEILMRSFYLVGSLTAGVLVAHFARGRAQLRERLEHQNRVLLAIRNVNQLITHERSPDVLLSKACGLLVETRGFHNAWAALLDGGGSVEGFHQAGFDGDFKPMADQLRAGELPDCARLALGSPGVHVVDDPPAQCANCPLSARYGGRVGFVARLEYGERLFGWLSVSVPKSFAQDEAEQNLFAEVVGDLGFALWSQEADARRMSIERKYADVLETTHEAVLACDLEGNITLFNPGAEALFGCPVDEALGTPIARFCPEDRRKEQADLIRRVRQEGVAPPVETERRTADGRRVPVETSLSLRVDAQGRPFGVSAILRDITERKQAESEREITLHILRAVSRPNGLHEFMRDITSLMRDWSGCDAVGIRLRDGEDYPYFETRGFPPDFVQGENRLCEVDGNGEVVRDPEGNPVLECMCGNVIRGRFDPTLPFFTEQGTFWTNSTSDLLASTTEEDRQSRTRNRCNGEGYESVALVPLRYGDEAFGLLQFNDMQHGRFDEQRIALFERLAANVALGLAQRRVSGALRESEEFASGLLDSAPHPIVVINRDSSVRYVNPGFEKLTGFTADETVGKKAPYPWWTQETLAKTNREFTAARTKGALRVEEEFQKRDGERFWVEITSTPMGAGEDRPYYLANWVDITERKRAEEALRASEEKFRLIAESGAEDIWQLDLRGQVTYASPAVERIFGYTPEEATKLHFGAFLEESQLDQAGKAFAKALAGEAYQLLEFEAKRKDGSPIPIEVGVTPVYQQDVVIGVQGIARDITERKQVEEALRTSEELFRTVFEQAAVGVAQVTPEGRFSNVNSRLCEIVGYTREELCAMTFREVTHPDDLGLDDAQIARVFAGEMDSFEIEKRYVHKKGHAVWIHLYSNVVRDPHGEIKYAIAAITDITAQKQAEEALRTSERRFHEMADLLPQVVWEADVEGRLLYVNQAALAIFGYDEKALEEGLSVADVIAPEERARAVANFAKAAQGQERGGNEYLCLRRDGSRFAALIYSEPIIRNGIPIGVRGITVDITERKQAEEALRESEDKYKTLADNAPQGVVIARRSPVRLAYANPAMGRLLGYRLDELMSMRPETLRSLVWEEDRQRFFETFQRRLKGENVPRENEYRLVCRDGSLKWVAVHSSLITFSGEPAALTSFVDITDRKRAEETREAHLRFLEKTTEVNQIIQKASDMEQMMSDVLQAALEMFETDRAWLLYPCDPDAPAWSVPMECTRPEYPGALALGEAIPTLPKDAEAFREALERHDVMTTDFSLPGMAKETSERFGIQTEMYMPIFPRISKPWLFGMHQCSHVREWTDEDKNLFREIGYRLGDGLRSMLFLRELHESEEKFRSIAEQTSDLIMLADSNGLLTYASSAARDLFRCEPEEMCGRPLAEFLDESALPAAAVFQRAVAGGEPSKNLELAMLRKDGTGFVGELGGRHFVCGAYSGSLMVIRDITERKEAEKERTRLEEQLRQSQKMESVGRLAGGVAHDFNNMLGVILGHTDMVLEEPAVPHPLRDSLVEIQKAAERSADLTRQLLAFARRQTVSPEVLDLNETVGGMLKMLSRLIGEDIELDWKPGAGLWPVRLDPSQIDQVLANLCVNARDAIDGVGTVTIETGNACLDEADCATHPHLVPGEYVELSVTDSGCGIRDDAMEHVFEPFFTTKPQGEGTGLGLATVYGIVKQNEGFIEVCSEAGQGAAFHIYLPRYVGKREQTEKVGGPDRAARGKGTVLVVEDERSMLALTKAILEQLGYKVLAAGTPGEAIALAQEHAGRIDVLLTDVIMPEMNGRELAKRLLTLYPGVKRIFMSGYTADIIAHHGVLDGEVHFLQKPFRRDVLAAKLREVLGQDVPGQET